MGFTEKQLKVINSRGGNLLVSASAGSGKTTVMIERILSLINDGESLSNMLICTFTRAAAADMRDKLASALLNLASDGDKRAEAQLLLLPTAEISTIHGWCQRMISKYFYEIGVDPAFEILDTDDADAMLNEAIENVITAAIEEGNEDFLLFYEVSKSDRSDRALKKLIRYVYDFAEAQADSDEFLRKVIKDSKDIRLLTANVIAKEEKKLVARFYPKALEMKVFCSELGYTKLIPYLCDFLAEIEGAPVAGIRLPRRKDDELKIIYDECKRLKELYKKARAMIDEFFEVEYPDQQPVFTELLLSLVRQVKARYGEMKQKKAKLDYADLEHYTCKLMQSKEIMQEMSEQYRYVFVDEYQDVNPLQERILSGFSKSRMFLVGDVKQSIYAFRMCDPNIFLDKYENYAELGFEEPIELNDNFRSKSSILNFTNLVMSSLMTDYFGRVNYARDAMLKSGLPQQNDAHTGVRARLVIEGEDEFPYEGVYSVERSESIKKLSPAEAEANLVVADVVERLRTPKEDGTPVKYSEIAILFASRSERSRLVYRKLKQLGIGVTLCDRDSFSSIYEVSVLCSFMKYLTDFTDDISLTALLRSPLVDVSDGELALIKLFSPSNEMRFYEACRLYAENKSDDLAKKLNAFYELSRRYLEKSYTRTAGELIGELVAEKKWFMQTFVSDDAKIKADALNAFLQHLSVSSHAKSVREYVEYLKRGNADFVPPPSGDSIRMMTIHASKGLEFPYVFLIDTSKKFSLREASGKTICDDVLGVCMQNYDLEHRCVQKNKLTFVASLKLRNKLLEERIRLLYVALTRAKEQLSIYATVKDNDRIFSDELFCDYPSEQSFFGWMRSAIKKIGCELKELCECTFSTTTEKKGEKNAQANESVVAAIREYFEKDAEYTKKYHADKKRIKSSVTAMMEHQKEETEVRYAVGEDDDRALRNGNAYHKAMEIISFEADFDAEWERIKSVDEIGIFVDREKLRRAVKAIAEFTRGKKLYREKQFILNESGRLIQGVIDLMAIEGDECIIVDYKTSIPQRIESGAYNLQLAVYSHAASKILGLKVKAAAIYSFESNKFTYLSDDGFNLQDIFSD